ncbi:FecR family protein [Sphingomonas sp. PAMC 26621]|uniref:FecR family protein n=1 Tax=Sphingomonas sp. PAMC 26621 TaxID=1112213 RepID=UPI000287B04A|nr:FecR family protein [Sphingomonas sp. PAMC 26621]
MRKRFIAIIAAGCSSTAMATEPGWTVSETSGPVQIGHGGLSKVATRGLGVAAGDTVTTGPGGRAVLVRGSEYMMVAAASRLRLPVEVQATGFTQVVQEVGNVVFMIKKKMTPHFEVKTPYLAAVVKGTTFSVGVTDKGASVQVLEGAVDVATGDGGAHDLLKPGSVAMVGAQDLYRMRVESNGVTKVVASPSAPGPDPTPAPVAAESVATAVAAPSETPASAEVPGAVSAPVAVAAPGIDAAIYEAPVSLAAVTNGLVSGTTGGAADIAELATITRSVTEASASAVKAVDTANAAIAAGAATAMASQAATTQSQAEDMAAQTRMAADQAARMAALAAQQAAEATAKANGDKGSSEAADAAAKAQGDIDAMVAAAKMVADQTAKAAAQAALDAANAAGDPGAQATAQKAAAEAARAADDVAKANVAAAQATADKTAKDASDQAAAKAAREAAKTASEAAKAATKAAADAAKQQADAAKVAAKAADDAAKAAAAAAAAAANNPQNASGGIVQNALELLTGILKGK